MTPVERIAARIAPFMTDGVCEPIPLLTLEEFFEGNDSQGSIWCNLTPADQEPVQQQAYRLLTAIRARDDVDDVRVGVSQFDDPQWPFAEHVVVVTDAGPDEVQSWFPEDLAPDETVPATDPQQFEDIGVEPGRLRVCWWD